jgi:hypothetical protein
MCNLTMTKCDLIHLNISIRKLNAKELGFYHENVYYNIYVKINYV